MPSVIRPPAKSQARDRAEHASWHLCCHASPRTGVMPPQQRDRARLLYSFCKLSTRPRSMRSRARTRARWQLKATPAIHQVAIPTRVGLASLFQRNCYLRRRAGDEARRGDVTDVRDDVRDDVPGAHADAPRCSRDASSRIHSATASETFSQPGWVTDSRTPRK